MVNFAQMLWQKTFLNFLLSIKLISAENVPNNCDKFFSSKYQFNTTHQMKVFRLRDASAKNLLPSGILQGNLFDLGNFEECYSTKDTFLNDEYYGKYCLGTLGFDAIKHLLPQPNNIKLRDFHFEILNPKSNAVYLYYGYCLPDFCTLEDFEKWSILKKVNFQEKYCYTKRNEENLNSGAIFTISLTSFFLFVVLISSTYEVYLNRKKNQDGKPKEPAHELMVAFSTLHNWPRIFNSFQSKDKLLCLNGLRAISMMWIIYYHEYLFHILSIWNNAIDVENYFNNWRNMYIRQGSVSVDTFFAIGGLVLTYTFMSSANRGDKYNPFMAYIHRYLRLTPVFALLVLIHIFLLNYMGNGPFWNYINVFLVQPCEQYWWSALLYIQTYTNTLNHCVLQCWYLSVDMQLYILAPLLLVPLKKWSKSTLIIMAILVFLQIGINFAISYTENFPASGYVVHSKSDDYDATLYFQTYARYGPYVLGMMTGYLIHKIKINKLKLKLRPLVVAILWPAILIGLLTILYGAYDIVLEENRFLENSIFNAFFRVSWAVCICAIIILCIAGYGGPINTFLSLPIFQVISNLSYCIYLVHFPILFVRISRKTNQFPYGNEVLAFEFWGDFAISFGLSVILSLTFEIPFINLEKYFSRTCTKKKT